MTDYLRSIENNYDDRLKVFYNEKNLGPSQNFNKILTNCRGQYVSFLTGDDVYLKDKLSKQVSWFKENGESAVLCGHSVKIVDDVSGRSKISRINRFNCGVGARKWIEYGHQYQAISIMVRRSAIPPIGFDVRIPIVNDQKFWIDVIGESGRYGCIPDVLATYNRTKDGLTANVRACWEDLDNLYSILERERPQWEEFCRRGRVNQILYGAAMLDILDGRPSEARGKFLRAFAANSRNIKPLIRYLQTFSWR
jgi:glycosyltransferase involved in cell wall biosynthesis